MSRYDGILNLRNANWQEVDRTNKSIMKIFKDARFSIIDKEPNLNAFFILDLTFNLNNGKYKSYEKSNHPPQIIN